MWLPDAVVFVSAASFFAALVLLPAVLRQDASVPASSLLYFAYADAQPEQAFGLPASSPQKSP